MTAGSQEIFALFIVAVVVGLAIWRRSRKRSAQRKKSLESASAEAPEEVDIHFYRRNKE